MPLISDITVTSKEIAVDYNGSRVKVTYNPSAYTPAFLDEMEDASTWHMLARLIIRWDLEREITTDTTMSGNPTKTKKREEYPHDEESLKTLPLEFLRIVAMGITNNMVPNQSTPENSGSLS